MSGLLTLLALFARTDGETVREHIQHDVMALRRVGERLRHDGMAPHRSKETPCLLVPLARRNGCWQHCRYTHPARWHGPASLERNVMPAGAAGPARMLMSAL